MDVLKIIGGRPLRGDVQVPGSKNAALALLSSVFLSSGKITLRSAPQISDVDIKLNLIAGYGTGIERDGKDIFLDCSDIRAYEPSEAMVRPIRTSFYLLGPILARVGHAVLPMPGGCRIGARPVDLHLKGLHALGAEVELRNGCYIGRAPKLTGAEIYLDFPSAGATQHLMATATLAEGVTTIENAAMEPEVVSLADFLVRMGARIEGAGTSTITIRGVKELGDADFLVPSDRVQASTYLLAGAITGGDVTVRGVLPECQAALVHKLREAGVDGDEGPDWVRVSGRARPNGIRVKTMPYPGFPTDIQQPMAALLTMADGPSVVEETIYESRTGHVNELNRMGAKMRIEGKSVVINGVNGLSGATVEASDLRAGAALVLAGLAAEGETVVKNVHYIDRGYEDLEATLVSLGGDIERVGESRGLEATLV
ncbi:MAG: UDP-N-acetylglucosamine 1-carboxyvinyltransferase [Fimbriimonadaceae bacterium]|nr:UDP-N-acetylglucosamine 1-carboxyvinyltransferase [Fimbriimonadaceae bacterium]